MRALQRLRDVGEHLDLAGHDARELRQSLSQIDDINHFLGGRRSLLHHLAAMLPRDTGARILDVGTGSGDLPRVIARWARKTDRSVRVHATDTHPQILEIARERSTDYPELTFQQADALNLPFTDGTFDCALLSLTLHHFEDEQQVRVLRELHRVSTRGIIVSELERNWPNYVGAKLLAATIWRTNRLTRHDGPISVLRAFTRAELIAIAKSARLPEPRVFRHFFFRLVLRTGVATRLPRQDVPAAGNTSGSGTDDLPAVV
jgi:ubiquinone/menaquinone biosynthesis C-methylase UbiE